MGRRFLKDRSGKISGAIAALLAIIVILIYTRVASTPKGSEDAFYMVYGAFKWFLKALDLLKYVEKYLKPFEEFLKYVRGTELWPLIISILALVVMELAVMLVYCGTWITIDTTTSILGLVSGIRTRRRQEKFYEVKSGSRLSGIVAALRNRLKWSPKDSALWSLKQPKGKKVKTITKKLEFWRRQLLTEWWDFRENQLITLKEGMLSFLIQEAKRLYPTPNAPDGSITKLAEKSGIDSAILCRAMNQEDYAMTVKNLEKLLNTLRIHYRDLTPYIKSIGGGGFKESIIHPKLPFDLYNVDGATLIAAGLKDGHIRKDRNCFEYANYNPENVRIVINSVRHVFGDVEYEILYDKDRLRGVRFNSNVVGRALKRAGVPEGMKTMQDYHLPDGIKFGDNAIKKAYFKHYIRDDGYIDYHGYQISMSNAHELESKFKSDHQDLLEYLP